MLIQFLKMENVMVAYMFISMILTLGLGEQNILKKRTALYIIYLMHILYGILTITLCLSLRNLV